MKQQKRRGPSRLISALLAMAMVLSLAPFAWAADTTVNDFAALKSAIESAADGDTITLGADISMTEKLTINKDITIVGDDKTISGNSSDVGIYFEISGGVLTISDAILTNFGNTAATSTGTGVFKIPDDADEETSGIVAISLTVEDFNRAAFDVRQGSFTITDCNINCDNGQTSGVLTKGVVAGYADDSQVTGTITGGSISGADSDVTTPDGSGWTASGIEVSLGATVTVEGVQITSMKGGISVAQNYGPENGTASVTVKGCNITANDFALRIFESNSSNPTPKGTAQLTVEGGTYQGDVRISQTGSTTGGNTSNSTITIDAGTFKTSDGANVLDVTRFVATDKTQNSATGEVTDATPGGNPGGGTTYPVNAPAVDNANVAANPSPAQPGQTVTVTVTPDEGYEASGVTVIGPGNVAVPVTDNGNGTYTFVMPEGGVTVNATVTPIQQPVFPFVDVPADAYYRQAVEYMYELGLIQGTSETTFGPMLASTRGQVVAILYRLEGSPAVNGSNPFVDATADWVQAAVLWASQNGIVEGYNDTV